MEDEDTWPTPRTREMFNAWFTVQLIDTVFDLVPEEPLTESDVELADLAYAFHHCAWCDLELEPEVGRSIGFRLNDRDRFAAREGLTLEIAVRDDRSLLGIMTPATSGGGGRRPCVSRVYQPLREGNSEGSAAWAPASTRTLTPSREFLTSRIGSRRRDDTALLA
jgi:hypothetical protein